MSLAKLFVVFLLLAAPALAWNEEGHRTVALVAERRLSPAAREYASSILAHHPFPNGRNLSDASCWPDKVRRMPEYHHGSWHFINFPVFLDSPERPLKVTGDILRAINANIRILKDRAARKEDKAVALAWIVHLVGDIHQPLHAANGYSNEFPEGDRGGGLLEVRLGQKTTDLHAFWDSAGGLFWKGANRHRLDPIVDSLMLAHAADQRVRIRSPKQWAEESHDLAKELAYPGVTANEELSQPYITQAREVSQERMTLAGYRLAELIERLSGLDAR